LALLCFFFLAAAAAVAAFPALLAKEQSARHKKVTNDYEDLLVFLLEFLRFRFSRMTSFASNKAFFAAASA
jgi:K+-transporting ATPase A subunit